MAISAAYDAQSVRLQDIIAAIAPKRSGFDPLGLVSGYRAYLVFTHLNAKTDSELAAIGLKRADIAKVAIGTISRSRAAA